MLALPSALHRELVVVLGVPADRGVHGALQRVGVALHQRVVGLVDGAVPEGVLEHGVGALGLRDHHHPGGADVEPLHDPLPLGGTARGDPEAGGREVPDDRRAGPAGARVHGHPDGLVDHHDRVVVVDDRDALDDLGDDRDRVDGGGDRHVEHRARLHPVGLGGRRAVDADVAARIRSAARVRDRPNIRAMAASTRSPASPSGTVTVRCSWPRRARHEAVDGSSAARRERVPSSEMPRSGLDDDRRRPRR